MFFGSLEIIWVVNDLPYEILHWSDDFLMVESHFQPPYSKTKMIMIIYGLRNFIKTTIPDCLRSMVLYSVFHICAKQWMHIVQHSWNQFCEPRFANINLRFVWNVVGKGVTNFYNCIMFAYLCLWKLAFLNNSVPFKWSQTCVARITFQEETAVETSHCLNQSISFDKNSLRLINSAIIRMK